jgi:DNA (cytosine-5)-methyltransferase 1
MSTAPFVNILFSGADGWATGLRPLGLAENAVGFEFDAAAATTARANGHNVVEGDLSMVNPAEHPALGLIGSPPCQGLSPAGKGEGRDDFDHLEYAILKIRDRLVSDRMAARPGFGWSPEQAIAWLAKQIRDPKSALILEPVRWALRMPDAPHWIALEQVKTALPIWEALADLYLDMGYSVWTGVVHMEEFGLGTTRERAILLASAVHDLSEGPTKTHTRYHHSRKTAGARYAHANALGLQPHLTAADLLGYRAGLVEPVLAWPERDTQVDAAWVYYRPMVAMVGSFRPDIAAGPGYRKPGDGPRQNAKGSIILTVEQAAKVQGFPDDYVWDAVSEADARLQIGNAVPPTLASILVRFVTTGV